MTKKGETIELEAGELKQSFELEHAERILKMPNNGGWKLPEGSKFKFDEKNGITLKTQGVSKTEKEATTD